MISEPCRGVKGRLAPSGDYFSCLESLVSHESVRLMPSPWTVCLHKCFINAELGNEGVREELGEGCDRESGSVGRVLSLAQPWLDWPCGCQGNLSPVHPSSHSGPGISEDGETLSLGSLS